MNKYREDFLCNRGQATVEFAIVLPLLLVILLGIFEMGNIIGSQMLIDNLAREGARNGAVGYDSTEITALINGRLLWLDPSAIQITVSPDDSARSKGQPLEVTVNYSVDLLTPFMGMVLPDPVPLAASCAMRIE